MINGIEREKREEQLKSRLFGVSCVYGIPLSNFINEYIEDLQRNISNQTTSFLPNNSLFTLHATLVRGKGLKEITYNISKVVEFFDLLFEDFVGFDIFGCKPVISEDGAIRCLCECDFLTPRIANIFNNLQQKYHFRFLRLPEKIWINIGEVTNGPDLKKIECLLEYNKFVPVQHVSEIKIVYFEDIKFQNHLVLRRYTEKQLH